MKAAQDLGRTVLLCLIGGSADAIAYVRFGTFVGAMSGNTVLLGIDIAEWHPQRAFYHACIVATFLIAVIAARAALLTRMPAGAVLVVTALMLGLSGLIGSEWSALVVTAGLGLQNAAVRKIGGVSINTVFVTGDLLRLGAAVPQGNAAGQQARLALLTTAWTAYAAGAVAGAIAFQTLSYPMAVPAVLALIAAALEMLVR